VTPKRREVGETDRLDLPKSAENTASHPGISSKPQICTGFRRCPVTGSDMTSSVLAIATKPPHTPTKSDLDAFFETDTDWVSMDERSMRRTNIPNVMIGGKRSGKENLH